MQKKLYVVTTLKCNLRCSHCYIDTIEEKFNEKVFLEKLNNFEGRLILFGGEFTSNMERLRLIVNSNKKDGISKIKSGTTNLILLNDELLDIYKDMRGLGTSWNLDRFGNKSNYELWKHNLKTVIDNGVFVTILITLTKDLICIDPLEFLKIIKDFIYKDAVIKLEQYVGSDVDQTHYDNVDRWLCELYSKWDLPTKLFPDKDGIENWYNDCSETYTLFPDGTMVNRCPQNETPKIPQICLTCERAEICRPCQLIPYCSYPRKLAKLLKEKK